MELSALLAAEPALPSIPKVVALLVSEVQRDDVDLRKISQLIGTDPSLTARLLQMANGPGFQLSRRIGSVAEALAVLGLPHLRQLASAAAVGGTFRVVPGLSMPQFWRYSLNVAKLSRSFASTFKLNRATAFTAGLLHALGEITMRAALTQEMVQLDASVGPLDLKRARTERKLLGYCYAEVSAGLARQWQLPPTIVDALQHQSAPFDNELYEPLAGVLHLASWRARAMEAGFDERELAVSFPGEVGLVLGMDIDMVLQQDPIDWTAGRDSSGYN